MGPLQSLLPEQWSLARRALLNRLAKRVCAVFVCSFGAKRGSLLYSPSAMADGHRMTSDLEEKLKLPDGTLHIQFSR
jgi:hypothetical protein